MNGKKKKTVTLSMILYELRNITGNPFIHIFGVGMPVFMSIFIIHIATGELPDSSMVKEASTSIFLGIGSLIPMASILMGYSVRQAQDLEKGIPQRLLLFGIKNSVTICNRAISEGIFMTAAFIIYFLAGSFFTDLQAPVLPGVLAYIICMLVFSVFCFILAHAIAALAKKFSITYCVSMLLFFAFMILGGLMGVSYDNMPDIMKALARLLPVTYMNRDFFKIWTGEKYNFVPMIQSYLFFGAFSGILLFIASRKKQRV